MMKKWGKIVTGIFLTAAMLAGTLGAGTAQEVVKAAGSTIKASGGQIKLDRKSVV